MFFKILKLFGIDIPAKLAEARIELEERFEIAKDQVNWAAQEASVLATLFVIGGLAALAAFGIGLVALYRWVTIDYGEFYGLAAVGGVLFLIAAIGLAGAIMKAKSLPAESTDRAAAKRLRLAELHAQRVAAAAQALEEQAVRPPVSLSSDSASDLVEPLALALSKMTKFPMAGHPVFDELLGHLQGSARGLAEEAVERAAQTMRYGERPQLLSILASAFVIGWFVGRHRQG